MRRTTSVRVIALAAIALFSIGQFGAVAHEETEHTICPEHGELKSDGIVSGYEHQKDQYVVIEPEDIDKLRTKSDRAVGIDGFIPEIGRASCRERV